MLARSSLALPMALAISGCQFQGPARIVPDGFAVEFRAVPNPPDFAVRGTFTGAATVRGDTLEVLMVPPTRVSAAREEASRENDLYLRAGLASGSLGGRWELTTQSAAVALASYRRRAERVTAQGTREFVVSDSLLFHVPWPRRVPLHRTWLVFQFEWRGPMTGRSGDVVHTTYAHSDTAMFANVLPPVP